MKRSAILSSQKRDLERRLRSLKRRRSQVDDILRAVRTGFDDNVRSIRRENDGLRSHSLDGLHGLGNIMEQNSIIESFAEREPGNDGQMINVLENLQQELNRIDREISDLEYRVNRLSRQITQAQADERRALV